MTWLMSDAAPTPPATITMTPEQLAQRDRDVCAEQLELIAKIVCPRCAMGLHPRKGPNGWEHPGVPGYRDDFGCDAAKIRDLA